MRSNIFNPRKSVYVFIVTILFFGLSSWGFLVHRTINQIAIYSLPAPLQSLFTFRDWLLWLFLVSRWVSDWERHSRFIPWNWICKFFSAVTKVLPYQSCLIKIPAFLLVNGLSPYSFCLMFSKFFFRVAIFWRKN